MNKPTASASFHGENETVNVNIDELNKGGAGFKRPWCIPRRRELVGLMDFGNQHYFKDRGHVRFDSYKNPLVVHVAETKFEHPEAPTHLLSEDVLVPPSFLHFDDWTKLASGSFAMRHAAHDHFVDFTSKSSGVSLETALRKLYRVTLAQMERFPNKILHERFGGLFPAVQSSVLEKLLSMVTKDIWHFAPSNDASNFRDLRMHELIDEDKTDISQLTCRIRFIPGDTGVVAIIHIFVSGKTTKTYLEATGFIKSYWEQEWRMRTPFCV